MSDTSRVFHLITRLLKGGAEAKTIKTVLGSGDYEFVVGYGAAFDPEQVSLLNENGVDTQRFRTIRHYNPVTAVPAVVAVAKYIRNHDFDLVHTHSTEAGIIGRFAASLTGTPVVHTVHGVPFADDRNAFLEQFVLRCERAAARRTNCMVTNAEAISRDYLHRGIGVPDQYTTVYSGIEIDRFRDADPASDICGSGIRVLMVGRLTAGKGFEDLLEALNLIDTDDFSVYIAGDGPLRDELEKDIDRLGLNDTVRLLGFRDDVPSIMAACDIFVLPSYREGTPRVITEAMASGLPVISTDIAGIPEQVKSGTNGFLITPGDVDALASRLDQLASDPELRRRFGTVGRERVERFSVDAMLSDIDDVYREAMESPN